MKVGVIMVLGKKYNNMEEKSWGSWSHRISLV